MCHVAPSTRFYQKQKTNNQITKKKNTMSLPLGIFSDRPLRLRIDRFPDQICQWEYIWSYFHIAEFIGTGGGDIQSLGHQTCYKRPRGTELSSAGTSAA